jgi:magnesium transporter
MGSIENIREHIGLMQRETIKAELDQLSVSELIDLYQELKDDEAVEIFLLMALDQKVELITHLSDSEQEWLLRSLSLEKMREVLLEIEPDDLADILQAVSPEVRTSVWESLSDEARRETQFLLKFDSDDAAGLMTPRYIALRSNISIAQAISFIRSGVEDIETIYYIYVVDQLQRLQGVISLREILFSNNDEIIGNKMSTSVVAVQEETDQEEVARILEDYDFIALPVVDRYNRLLGIITFDDVIDVIREEQTEDIYRMGAMEGSSDVYLETGIGRLLKKRIPWLILLLLTGTITTNVLALTDDILSAAAFLVLFIPVITQTGGNSGTQSSTLMIRGIAMGNIDFRDIGKVVLKEIAVGIIMGLILGAVIILRSVYLPPGIQWFEGAVIGLSLIFVVLFSTVIGAMAPLVIHRFGWDPTVIAGPLMSTFIDVIGLTIYTFTAKLMLGL